MASSLTYLITGANRGIGKGFVASLLQRPNTTVIAAVRDVARSTPALASLPTVPGSKLLFVKLDSSVETDPKSAVAQLRSEHGITSLDIVIANAGIAQSSSTVLENSAENMREHFNVNSIGPILLFQAVKPLLQASKSGNPIFLGISTAMGSMGTQEMLVRFPQPFSPYGASKAALNWFVRKIHFEEPWVTAYVTHPGLVITDMAKGFESSEDTLRAFGGISIETSVEGMLKTLDKAVREIGGTFQNWDGTTLPW